MYRITVKSYMTQKSTPSFDFMEKWNSDIPMPLRVMTGRKLEETRGMVKMELHGDIEVADGPVDICMCCGRPITNPVSKYFGMGPICGQHNYVNPFDSEEELKAAVAEYKKHLNEITWTGWIIKSAITAEEDLGGDEEIKIQPKEFKLSVRIDEAEKLSGMYSAFIRFPYNALAVRAIKELDERWYHYERREWEITVDDFDYVFDEQFKAEMLEDGFDVKVEVHDFVNT